MTDAAKIEAGKKYRHISGFIAEIIFIGKKSVFVRRADGAELAILINPENWTEVREPQTIVGFVNVWRCDNGKFCFGLSVYDSEEEAREEHDGQFAIHRIEYTDPTEGSSS